MKIITNWIMRDAKWYHFWRPQSGFIGGFIFGAIILGLTL